MIKLEDYKKLNQLDRIEFLLRRENLEKVKDSRLIDCEIIIKVLLFIGGFLMLIFLGMSNLIGIEKSIIFLSLSVKVAYIGIIFCIICILYNIAIKIYLFKKLDNNLEEEFFKKEVKPKK